MSRQEQIWVNMAIQNDKAKAVRLLKERGYSDKTIARFMEIPENTVRYMVRRE